MYVWDKFISPVLYIYHVLLKCFLKMYVQFTFIFSILCFPYWVFHNNYSILRSSLRETSTEGAFWLAVYWDTNNLYFVPTNFSSNLLFMFAFQLDVPYHLAKTISHFSWIEKDSYLRQSFHLNRVGNSMFLEGLIYSYNSQLSVN